MRSLEEDSYRNPYRKESRICQRVFSSTLLSSTRSAIFLEVAATAPLFLLLLLFRSSSSSSWLLRSNQNQTKFDDAETVFVMLVVAHIIITSLVFVLYSSVISTTLARGEQCRPGPGACQPVP
ncbi:hypothetical protein AKJ16_DCAP10081 [Drosera capensis]